MFHGILTALVSTFGWVIVQNLRIHLRPNPLRFHGIMTSYLLSLPLVYFVHCWMPVWFGGSPHETRALGWAHAYPVRLLLLAFCVECFFHFEHLLTLPLLEEILHAGSQGADLESLRTRYPVGQMVVQRLEMQFQNGFRRLENGQWQSEGKAKPLARFAVMGNWHVYASAQNERE
jgi:hypothetical protein